MCSREKKMAHYHQFVTRTNFTDMPVSGIYFMNVSLLPHATLSLFTGITQDTIKSSDFYGHLQHYEHN